MNAAAPRISVVITCFNYAQHVSMRRQGRLQRGVALTTPLGQMGRVYIYVERCDANALALYLFLLTVADRQGLSYYSGAAIVRSLSVDVVILHEAGRDLVQAGLIAYETFLYQVLALDPPRPLAQWHGGMRRSLREWLGQALDRAPSSLNDVNDVDARMRDERLPGPLLGAHTGLNGTPAPLWHCDCLQAPADAKPSVPPRCRADHC